ncbi:MAG: DUF4105 domain-containing protein [Muribaculaceae bacterium]|nr:DUF4105 domain-containing protein [Muribaculaceae bacterium]
MNLRLIHIIMVLTALWPACRGEITASLLTIGPGAEIYELDGHTALRLRDADRGTDMAVNWGVFDFDSPNFVYRFVKGETDYLCVAMPTEFLLREYARAGRSVSEQSLNLTPAQTERLAALVGANLLPQNRVYRYSYIHDNCATRPLLLIEQAIGRPLVADSLTVETFRTEMMRNHRAYPWYQFGIDLALGSGLDGQVTRRQLCFSPLQLERVIAADPAVEPARVIVGGSASDRPATPWWLTPLAVGWAVAAITLCVTAIDIRRRRISRWIDTAEFGLFGLTGCLIAFLVFVSSHSATSPNWLIVWLNPLCLLGAVLPWLRKSGQKWLNCYHFANFAVLIAWILLWPLTGQHMNPAFWPWILSDLMRSGAHVYICRKN